MNNKYWAIFYTTIAIVSITAIIYGLEQEAINDQKEKELQPICIKFCIAHDSNYNNHILATKRTGKYLICECQTIESFNISLDKTNSDTWHYKGRLERFNLEVI